MTKLIITLPSISIKRTGKYADMVKCISEFVSDERGAKCGYDLFMGYHKGDIEKRYKAWIRFLAEHRDKKSHTDEMRDGVYVPAIEL